MPENPKYVLMNGEFLPWSEGKVHLTTHGFMYGTMVFEGIRGYVSEDGKDVYIFRLMEHIERLLRNGKILRLEPRWSAKDLAEGVAELVRRNEHKADIYIRPGMYFGEGSISLAPSNQSTDYFVFTAELGNYFGAEKPLSTCISSWVRIDSNALPPSAKIAGSYVNSMLASKDAKKMGFDEAIFLTHNGFVSEGAGENIFIIRNGKIATPPLSADILEGITRDSVIRIAQEEGIEVEVRDIYRSELYTADEVFFTGTAAEISPIGSIDGRPVGDGGVGPTTAKLKSSFKGIVRGGGRHSEWLTSVYK